MENIAELRAIITKMEGGMAQLGRDARAGNVQFCHHRVSWMDALSRSMEEIRRLKSEVERLEREADFWFEQHARATGGLLLRRPEMGPVGPLPSS